MKSILIFLSILFLTPSVIGQNLVEFAPNRLILRFKSAHQSLLQARESTQNSTFGIPEIDRLNLQLGCKKIESIKGGGIVRSVILEFNQNIDVKKAVSEYQNTGQFESVEPDFIGHGDGAEAAPMPPLLTPNDTYFSRQWGLKNNGTFAANSVAGNDIKMIEAWDITTGDPSVIVCILDSGCKLNHPDLAGRIWQNTKEIAGNGIDDDQNGRIDDTQGWDFANSDNDPTDDHGHGTNVTSIVGCNGNNNLGYAGVDWKCKLMIIKGLDNNNSGFYSWWISGIYYAVENGAKVINMSLVGNSYSATLEAAVDYAWSKGVVVVACMGNNNSGVGRYPANSDNIIAVGSVSSNGKRTVPFCWKTFADGSPSGSNYGSNIDVVAPGEFIFGLSFNSNNDDGSAWCGTSQATPHVAGLAALVLARNKNLTPAQVKDLIQRGADDLTGDPSEDRAGFDNFYGWGRINAKKTLNLVPLSSTLDRADASAQLVVFPNPSKGVFNLQMTEILRGSFSLEVSNLMGQIVFKKSLQSIDKQEVMNVDLSNIAKGIYFLRLRNEDVFMTKKIVID